jgi:hypothetical protein
MQIVAYIETTSELTGNDKHTVWYQSADLEEMKVSARRLYQSQLKGCLSPEQKEQESTRGMEVYYPSRQKNHKKFVDHVLEAYHCRCAGNDEHVGMLAERWSMKSKQRAITKATEDFYEAYFPSSTHHHHHCSHDQNKVIPIPTSSTVEVMPTDLKRKGSNPPAPERVRRCL